MRRNLKVVTDAVQLAQIRRFRYEVYVHELCVEHPNAHHGSGEFYDELDDFSTIYALVDDDDQILGTLRCTILSDLPNPEALVKKFSMEPFVEYASCASIATTSRFMLRPDRRKTTDILELLRPSVKFGLERGIRFNFGTTRPFLLNYYERLGYRRYCERVEDDIFGFDLPIVMLARDMDYLSLSKSPLVRYLAPGDDDPEARRWFNARYGMYSIFSPVGRIAESMEQVYRNIGFAADILVEGDFGRLPKKVRHDLLMNCSIIEFRQADRITHLGETDKIAFVCLLGVLARCDNHGKDNERVIRPGGVFFGGEPAAVIAQTYGLVLSLPMSQSRKLSQESRRAVDDWFARLSN